MIHWHHVLSYPISDQHIFTLARSRDLIPFEAKLLPLLSKLVMGPSLLQLQYHWWTSFLETAHISHKTILPTPNLESQLLSRIVDRLSLNLDVNFYLPSLLPFIITQNDSSNPDLKLTAFVSDPWPSVSDIRCKFLPSFSTSIHYYSYLFSYFPFLSPGLRLFHRPQ